MAVATSESAGRHGHQRRAGCRVPNRQRDGRAVREADRLPPDGLLPDHTLDRDRRDPRRDEGRRRARHHDGAGRRRARRGGDLLRRRDRRRPRLQRDQLPGAAVRAGAAARAVGDALPDAARPRHARGERAAGHPRRPLRPLLRAQHRLADLHGARPAGRLRHEPDRLAGCRARRRAAARDRGLRRLLHQPPEAPRLELRGRRDGAGLARPGAGDGDGARPAAPGDDRPVHERPGPDQQQVSARAGDGRGAGRASPRSSPSTRS